MGAQACGFACAFRKIVSGLTQTAQNGIQQGKQRRQQGDRSGQVVRQDMQGEFAFDRTEPTAPKAVKPLLATQAAEHRFDDRLALAKNAARLTMLHHEAKRLTLLILGVAFDASSLRRFRTVRAQMAIPTGRGPIHAMLSCARCLFAFAQQPRLLISPSAGATS
jgi:hypothetical protein